METFVSNDLAFVIVNCSDGISGLGQMSHPTETDDQYVIYSLFNYNIAPIALNYTCEDPANLANYLWNANYKATGTFLSRGIAGIEAAIYDAMG